MRNFLRVVWLVLGTVIAIVLPIVIGLITLSFFIGLVALAILFCFVFAGDWMIRNMARSDMGPWLTSVSGSQYTYAWDGYGIALNIVQSHVHLSTKEAGRVVAKTYVFSDIREWGFEAPGAQRTQVFGNVGFNVGIGVAAANAASLMQSEDGTGFWVKVKDIDHPRWFVKFGGNPNYRGKDVVISELERWMEIFSQHINRE